MTTMAIEEEPAELGDDNNAGGGGGIGGGNRYPQIFTKSKWM